MFAYLILCSQDFLSALVAQKKVLAKAFDKL